METILYTYFAATFAGGAFFAVLLYRANITQPTHRIL